MVGVDWYTSGNLEIKNNNNYLDMIDQTHKIGSLTEFGIGSGVAGQYNTDSLIVDLWTLMEEGYSFAYLLTWHNECGSSIGNLGGETGGFEFMDEQYTLGQAEVKAMFDALK
jgi:hypothetical protein